MEKFEISLVSISEKEFYLSPKDNLNINEKYLNLGFGFQFKGKDNSDFIEMVVSIVYLYKTAKVEKELLKFKTAFEFEVSNLEKFITIDKEINKIDIQDNLSRIFLSTAISTTRGMLFFKTAGTYMSKFIIPLMDVNHFIELIKNENISKGKKISKRNIKN